MLGKSKSTLKPNVGIYAQCGYQCHAPKRRGPRPADVKRLSAPRMPRVPGMKAQRTVIVSSHVVHLSLLLLM